ncbi:MAG: DUF3810 domain-containing protein [Clostridia bacterium]|nr:DUF3810 domain-containing protein [Clostridia bacterium]
MVGIYRKITRLIPPFSLFLFITALAALGVHIGAIANPAFADRFNGTFSQALRSVTAHLTGILPFSLAEFIVMASPVILAVIIAVCLRKASRGARFAWRCVIGLLSVCAGLYAMFVFHFGVGYRTTSLDAKLGLDRQKVTAEELYETAKIVAEKLNELADEIILIESDGSVRPYSHDTAVDLCVDSYAALAETYDFIPTLDVPVKQIVLSDYMTYTHISGVYTFFTGEANLNTNYPDYVNVYTTAHEMAHQRGIARENEANFIAYLVCITSDDPYMQYAGYLSMFDYLASPLYTASKDYYLDVMTNLSPRARYDRQCYSEFFDKYRDNAAADVSDTVNNTYLVLQGMQEGAKSYGMVVDLAVAYHLGNAE